MTAGVTFAGSGPGSTNYVNNTEEWDGSSWSETADLNTGRTEVSGCGPAQTAGFCIGGNIDGTRQAVSETYDGSSWTEVADLNTARNNLAAAGTTTAAIVAGVVRVAKKNKSIRRLADQSEAERSIAQHNTAEQSIAKHRKAWQTKA